MEDVNTKTTRENEYNRVFGEDNGSNGSGPELSDLDYEEAVRLKRIRKEIEDIESLHVDTISDRNSKIEARSALVEESQAILEWLQGRRDTSSELDNRLPCHLRSKVGQTDLGSRDPLEVKKKDTGLSCTVEVQYGDYSIGRQRLLNALGCKSFNTVKNRVKKAGMEFSYTEEPTPRPMLKLSEVVALQQLDKKRREKI